MNVLAVPSPATGGSMVQFVAGNELAHSTQYALPRAVVAVSDTEFEDTTGRESTNPGAAAPFPASAAEQLPPAAIATTLLRFGGTLV